MFIIFLVIKLFFIILDLLLWICFHFSLRYLSFSSIDYVPVMSSDLTFHFLQFDQTLSVLLFSDACLSKCLLFAVLLFYLLVFVFSFTSWLIQKQLAKRKTSDIIVLYHLSKKLLWHKRSNKKSNKYDLSLCRSIQLLKFG